MISGDRLLALLAHTAGMPDESAAHFEDALVFCDKAGYRLESAWTGYDYAKTLLEQAVGGESSRNSGSILGRAISLLDDAIAIAREIGSEPLEQRLNALQEKAASLAAPAATYPDGLTGREVEVLRLLAVGRTNQQIADELTIAPTTAAKHVANILGKTGTANRTEAATYANQQSLLAVSDHGDGLTEREVEVLRLLAAGHTNREIARELVLSERTVQRHISNIYNKIDVRNRVEASSFALNKLAGPAGPPNP